MTIQVFCWQKAFKTNNSRAIILAGGAGYTWGKKNAGVWVVGNFLFDKVFFGGPIGRLAKSLFLCFWIKKIKKNLVF